MTIYCQGKKIRVAQNGAFILEADLTRFTDVKFNPDDKNYASNFGEPVLICNLTQAEAVQEFTPSEEKAGRYIAIVFRNSYSSAGYVDLWEFEAFGYVAGNVD